MHFHFHLTAVLLSLFALLHGNHAAPPPAGTLMVFRNEGGKYNGYYLHAFHVAAGISVPTLEPNFSTAASVELLGDTSLVVATNPSVPFYIRLLESSDRYTWAPAGYETVLIDARVESNDFHLSQPDNRLVYNGPRAEEVVFAACLVAGGIPPYESQGPQVVIFWRWVGSEAWEGCEEVYLVAQY